MATSIDQAFIKQFEREVHESYQRQGSKLRNTVRTISEVEMFMFICPAHPVSLCQFTHL